MREFIYALVGGAFVLDAVLWMRGVYAMFMAANHRQPGVGYFSALNSFSIAFCPNSYTNEGQKWCATFVRCTAGSVAVLVGILIMFVAMGDLPTSK